MKQRKLIFPTLLFGVLTAFLPVAHAKAETTHYLRPYQNYNSIVYDGDPAASFNMMGKTYTHGVRKSNYNSVLSAAFDLKGETETVSFTVGHLDKADSEGGKLEVYLDGELQTGLSMNLTSTMANKNVSVDTEGANQLILKISCKSPNYGIADITETGMHNYTSEITKIVRVNADGERTYNCIDCGDSYTEPIPKTEYCTPHLNPYQYPNSTSLDETEGSDTFTLSMGQKYYHAVYKNNYAYTSDISYLLNEEYDSITFLVGHRDGTETDAGTLHIFVDETEMKQVSLTGEMQNTAYTINTEGAQQIRLQLSTKYPNYSILDIEGKTTDPSLKEHVFEDTETTPAKPGIPGVMTHRCRNCGAFYTSRIEPVKKSLKDSAVSVLLEYDSVKYDGTPATPQVTVSYGGELLEKDTDYTVEYSGNTEPGQAAVTVSGIGNYTDSITTAYIIKENLAQPHTHLWNTGIVTTPATCGQDGIRTFTCSDCQETKTETIPATGRHTWNNGTVTNNPTSTSKGTKTFTCSVCGATRTEAIPMLSKPSVSKVTGLKASAGKKKLTISWKKISNAAGYELQYSSKSSFQGAKTKKIAKSRKSVTISKLKAKKKYYVRIRAFMPYLTREGVSATAYGKWTKISKKTK